MRWRRGLNSGRFGGEWNRKRMLRGAGIMVIAAILARIQFCGGLIPFAAAFLAASAASGEGAFALIGALTGMFGAEGISVYAAASIGIAWLIAESVRQAANTAKKYEENEQVSRARSADSCGNRQRHNAAVCDWNESGAQESGTNGACDRGTETVRESDAEASGMRAFRQGKDRNIRNFQQAETLDARRSETFERFWKRIRHSILNICGERTAAVGFCAAAALAILIPGAAIAAEEMDQIARVLGSAAAAAASVPMMRAFAGVRRSRRYLMPEERFGGALIAMGLVGGLECLLPPAAMGAAVAMLSVLSFLGAGAAACAGVALGGMMIVCGADARSIAFLAAVGAAAGAFSRERTMRVRGLIGAAIAAGMAAAIGVGWESGAVSVACGLLSALIPERIAEKICDWAMGERGGACDPDRLARRLRGETGRRLRAMGEAFGEMAEGYRIPVELPNERALIARMRENLCDGCSRYAECWAGEDNRAVRFLCQLISEAIDWAGGDGGESLFDEELPPELLRACARGRAIPDRLGELLENFARLRRSEMKRGAVNQLISAQFTEARMLLEGLAAEQLKPLKVRGRMAARARAALDQAGVDVSEVMVLRGARRTEVVATLESGGWSPDRAWRAAERLSRVFGRRYVPSGAPGEREMRFRRQTRLRAETSARKRRGNEALPSGDSCLAQMLEGDRLMLVISDGMGSGTAAARESAQTVRLLSRFLSADVSMELALETVNELMLARTDADMFATVDLCVIDLGSGEAEFSKLAACQSLIVRGGEPICISGGRLPLGILEGVTPSMVRVQLQPGDVILMASDGVMDAVDEHDLVSVLRKNGNADALAEATIELAAEANAHRDDMTALVCRLENRFGRKFEKSMEQNAG